MQFLVTVAAAALLPALAAATGSAQVVNNCGSEAYLFSADASSTGGENNLTASGGSYSEAYRGAGIVLKIMLDPSESGLYDPSVPLMQFQYTLDGSTVYYALADTRGDPFAGHQVTLDPSDSSCTAINWADGSGPSTVYTCGSGANLKLTLCA